MSGASRPSSVRLTPRIFIVDADTPRDALPAGALALPAHRSRAFGDGTHETTRLAARALDVELAARRGARVLDVGTGTGVLARIARARGASLVVGTDIDPLALAVARENALLDDDARPILFDDALPDAGGRRFDVVVANILTPVLVSLAPHIAGALEPQGVLFLSGFTRPEVPALRVAYAAHGVVVERDVSDGAWVLLRARRAP